MKHIILIGASGHGRIAADIAEEMGYKNISFLDDAYPKIRKNSKWVVTGIPEKNKIRPTEHMEFFISIGNNNIREQISIKFDLSNSPILCHPSAIISKHSKIAQGTLIGAGSIINFGANIGKHTIINTNASIDHDCIIGDFVHISPGVSIAGGVSVGARTWVGIGASIRENVKIGKDVIIGAGAAVVNDIDDNRMVLGVPAKVNKE